MVHLFGGQRDVIQGGHADYIGTYSSTAAAQRAFAEMVDRQNLDWAEIVGTDNAGWLSCITWFNGDNNTWHDLREV